MDGIVCARSVFSHSVNYRGAVVLGVASIVVDEDERWQAPRLIADHLAPGRWAALPMAVIFGEQQPDPLLDGEIPVPAHIRDAVTPRNTP